MNKILIFSAPSGSGKSTIINYLLKQGLPLGFSISATSRAPRGEEKHGVEYYFLSADEFRTRIEKGDFIEHEEVYSGCFYGTLRSEIDRVAAEGKTVVFDVDVKGGENIKRQFGENALSIFIMPPSVEELRKRLIGRATDSMEKIEQRVAKAAEEISHAPNFDRVIINDDLDKALAEAYSVVKNFLGME